MDARELAELRPRLLRFALRRLGNREQAEDAVQEALLAALEGRARFGGASQLGTWLTGILKHKIADVLRAPAREAALDEAHDLPYHGAPEEALARRRALEAVAAGLKQLPSCAARVFVLREVMGMDTQEICRELAISRSNCWVLHYRARHRLAGRPEIRDAL